MIKIRDFHEKDIPVLQEIRNNNKIQEILMAQKKTESKEDTKNWVQQFKIKNIIKIICLIETDQCIGYIQITDINHFNKYCFIGIVINENFQGKGYGEIALKKVFKYLTIVLGIRKVLLYVLNKNINAKSLYKKIGFKESGKLKKHFLLKSTYEDVLIMEKFLDEK